jgi:uracil phosphoribosyltransferase
VGPEVIAHAAVADRLVRLRDRRTPVHEFRRLIEEIGWFLAYEATRGLPTVECVVQTPVSASTGRCLAGRPVVVPILRAGLGLLTGFLRVIEEADVVHLGIYRDPRSLAAVAYYENLPETLAGRTVYVLDPMLATGNTGVAALRALADHGARDVTFLCVLAAPEGVRALTDECPGLRVVVAALDTGLNEHGYIVPGLGDAGDRMFGSIGAVPTTIEGRRSV